MMSADEKVRAKVKQIIEQQSDLFSYGMFMMVLLIITKESYDVATVTDNIILSFAQQLTGEKDLQLILFHGIKNGISSLNFTSGSPDQVEGQRFEIAATLKECILTPLLLNYSRFNLLTYEQCILNLQDELYKLKKNPAGFNFNNNFFLNKTEYPRRETDKYIHKEKMLEITDAVNNFSKPWKEIYAQVIDAHQKTNLIGKIVYTTIKILGISALIYFTQFRNSELTPEPSENASDSDWDYPSYLLLAAITLPIFFQLVLAPTIRLARSAFPKTGVLLQNSTRNRSKDSFALLFSTLFKVDLILLSELPEIKNGHYACKPNLHTIAPVAIVVTSLKESNFDVNKLLDYKPLDPMVANSGNLYKMSHFKKKPSIKDNLTNNNNFVNDNFEANPLKAKLETIEWHIEELNLHFILRWDRKTKLAYQFENETQICGINYVENSEGIKYFCFIPSQTIENQHHEITFLQSVKKTKAKLSSNEISYFKDGISRKAILTIPQHELAIGKSEEDELIPEKSDAKNPAKSYLYDMDLSLAISAGHYSLLGKEFNAVGSSKAILVFAPVLCAESIQYITEKQKTSFGKIVLASKDLEGIIIEQELPQRLGIPMY